MRRFTTILLALVATSLCAAPASQAAFGLSEFEVEFTDEGGAPALRAGSHPFAMTTALRFNTTPFKEGTVPDEAVKDVIVGTPPGFVGDVTALPQCTGAEFITISKVSNLPACSDASAIGYISVELGSPSTGGQKMGISTATYPVYNLEPDPGQVNKLGFIGPVANPVQIAVKLSDTYPYEPIATAAGITQQVSFYASKLTIWGDPADPAHDPYRGSCLNTFATKTYGEVNSLGKCKVSIPNKPFITLPRSCKGPLLSTYLSDSWQKPGLFVSGSDQTAESTFGCSKLPFKPTISAKPTTKAASSPTGLDFSLDVKDEGLANPSYEAVAAADIEKAVVTLPQGFSANPSLAEGLEVCSEADLARETVGSAPGAGCPNASKIGTVDVESTLVPESVNGSLFIAKPYENPFNSLLALYIVIKNPKLGIIVKQPLKVENDPVTGQITTVATEIPPLPFSHFKLHFREGARSPLASPPGCGTYAAQAVLTPSSGGPDLTTSSLFDIVVGPNEGPCPTGGLPPFKPGLIAGSLNNTAGRHTPFNLRLFRTDSEQEFTNFSIKLPPGITGKLAGIPFCSEAQIAAAKAREAQPHGGAEELAAPSCPSASEVGHTLVGSGVGPALTYVPGKIYLAGPYNGSALSIVAITAAVAGPFDLGAVVVRQALRINPETAEVFIDATGSDPIPHIIRGIPVHLRDVRAYVDRPGFVLNPTSCKPTSTASTLLGSGLDFASAADNAPVTVATRFQAADCGALGFKPRLELQLRGSTRRGGNPALRAILRPRAGDANSSRISVALPHSEFLDQAHIRTICTRAQFKAGAGNGSQCPAGAVYGHATAYTPLLEEPLQGPVFLRASDNPLPDLVLALKGLIEFNAVGRIDSVNGGIRNTFDFVPDAPITKVVVDFQGGKKGLLENSTNLCKGTHKAKVSFAAHNGRSLQARSELVAKCPKARKDKGAKRRGR